MSGTIYVQPFKGRRMPNNTPYRTMGLLAMVFGGSGARNSFEVEADDIPTICEVVRRAAAQHDPFWEKLYAYVEKHGRIRVWVEH